MSQSELSELYRLIRELTATVAGLGTAVGRIDERIKLSESLAQETKAIDERVKALELDKAKVEGVGLAAKALWAFVGAGGIGVLVMAYNALTAVHK